jgi:UDPglucose 6-dehydrogenase
MAVGGVSVFGLGKVGLTLAACLADAGHHVIGADVDETRVGALNRNGLETTEPGLRERLARTLGRTLTVTCEAEQCIQATDLTFLVVPTPSNSLGGFSLRYVKKACEQIGSALRHKNSYHVIAIVSTMLPGSSELVVIPLIEKSSGRKVGQYLGYCYNPAFIALGEVVKGFVEPDYVLIGQADERAGDRVLAAHEAMIRKQTPIARMSPIEAEITKVASNTHETMRVSFANMLCSLCTVRTDS